MVMEWSKMNSLFIYNCTNFAQILTYRLYIKMATYKHAKQNSTKFKKKKNILSHDSSTLFHMPFKDHIPDSSQIITFITFIFLQKHFKNFK